MAPVLAVEDRRPAIRWQRWGFPGFRGKQVIFNARSESALEKRLFRDSVKRRRVVIPAAWFYEWNKNGEKNTFSREKGDVLYMAGFYDRFGDGDRFIILTTGANASMRPVHDRMPLILEREEVPDWMYDARRAGEILHKTPCLLNRRTDYEQMSFL